MGTGIGEIARRESDTFRRSEVIEYSLNGASQRTGRKGESVKCSLVVIMIGAALFSPAVLVGH